MANILVVGGAGGVGLALVDLLVGRGDQVTTTVLNDKEAAQVKSRHGAQVAIHCVDFSDNDRALEVLREIASSFDRLDAVAGCVGISPFGPVETVPLEVYRNTFEINCLANVVIYQATMPALRRNKGRIVFISSMAGRVGLPFIGPYVASKFALEGVADAMRREAAAQGVQISLVEPSGIRTTMVGDQIKLIKTRIAELSEEENALYGHYYRRFEKIIGKSYQDTGMTPEQVAEILLEALDAEEPETRYIAGDSAQKIIEMDKRLSDRELDTFFQQMYSEE